MHVESSMHWNPFLATAGTVTLLLLAVGFDLSIRRIPNVLLGVGLALGLFFQAAAPSGNGLFSAPAGGLGATSALFGGAAGLALFLPLYLMRAMGAGDVKLLAMVGVWLGAPAVLRAALWTLLAGGVLSVAVALGSGVLRQVLGNLRDMVFGLFIRPHLGQGVRVQAPPRTTGRLPYAVAIACGTAVEMARLLTQAGT